MSTRSMTPDEYEPWLNACIGREVRRRREAAGLSAYRLGRLCGVTDQTILNIEQGRCDRGCRTGTLANYNQQQMQDVLNKLDELIAALRR